MKEDLINHSIQDEKLHLDLPEKISYFTFPALLIFGSFLCLTNGFQNLDLSKLEFADTIPKTGVLLFILGLTCLIVKLKGLRLHSVDISNSDVKRIILQAAEKRNWQIVSNQKQAVILKTSDRYSYDNVPFKSRLTGHLIYIFFTPRKVLFISITDLKGIGLNIPNGENTANEKYILNSIKPAANTR